MQKIVIFGITGSIGQQAWELIKDDSNFELVGFSFHSNYELANKIKNYNKVKFACCSSDSKLGNVNNFEELIQKTNPDLVLNSLSGFSGLSLTQYCLDHNIKLALANKESMVVAGHLIDHTKIIPIDSELSSIYCLVKNPLIKLKTIYITASGGPFYNYSFEQLININYQDAIKHPTYNMGGKISIDSATLVNKCFEMIEAYYLFGVKDIKPLYHPTSIVHALVVDQNNAIYSYMSNPDMKLAINLALNNFVTNKSVINPLSLNNLNLYFEEIDDTKYLPIKWAKELIHNDKPIIGLIITIVDDFVIELFKQSKICFLQITQIIDQYVQKYKNYQVKSWEDIYNFKTIIIQELANEFNL